MKTIKARIIDAFVKAGISIIKMRSPILKEIFDNPENVKVVSYVEDDEVIIRIKKRWS